MVDTGDGAPVQVVCGAPNARAGMKSVFARPGTYIPGKKITLGVGTIRGVEAAACCARSANSSCPTITTASSTCRTTRRWESLRRLRRARRSGDRDQPHAEPADALGVHGIARDLAAPPGLGKLKDKPIKPVRANSPARSNVKLDFGDTPSLCPAFALRLVRGVKNGPSPEWLQKRLKAIGLRPINALVDITNYVTFDRGRPLHVFDAAKVKGDLTVRRARRREIPRARRQDLHARSGPCASSPTRTASNRIAGIMGGEDSGCDETPPTC
jgi:phenylalanyl-tRNA synthetase beta chain